MAYRDTLTLLSQKPLSMPFEREFKVLSVSLKLAIAAHQRMKVRDRPVSVMLPVAKAAVLDLPAYGDLVDEVLHDHGVRLERDLGFPPATPEYFIRIIFPAPPLPLMAPVIDIEVILERDMDSFSDCRYAPRLREPPHLRVVRNNDAPS